MKQLGPNLWCGDYELLQSYKHCRKILDSKRLEEDCELNKLKPSQRFWKISRNDWARPWKFVPGQSNYYRMQEFGLMELAGVQQADFPDIEDCQDFMLQIRTLYVCDLHQGKGVGRRILDQVKEVADRSGCVVFLFVRPFGFDSGSGTMMGIRSWEELVTAAIEEERDVLYWKKTACGSVRNFYEVAGFTNICLAGPRSQPDPDENDAWQYEYCYLPKSLERLHREQLAERLNAGLSRFCNC